MIDLRHKALQPNELGLGKLALTLSNGGGSAAPTDVANGEMDFTETTESALIVLLEDI